MGAAAIVAAVLIVCGTAAAEDAVIARSGSITLTESAVRDLIQRADAEERARLTSEPALLSQFVRTHVARLAVLAEAKTKAWDQKPDVARKIEDARNAVIIDSYLEFVTKPPATFPSEAEIQAAYEANRSKLMQPRAYRLGQIFLAVPADGGKAAEDGTLKKIQDLQQQIIRKKADFAELARRTAEENAPNDSGEVGWTGEDQLLPVVRDALAGLEVGSVSEPLRSPSGWHLVKLLETRPAQVAPLPEVRDRLVEALRDQRSSENVRLHLAQMFQKSPVQINEIQLAKIASSR
jgi:peptidylprolyl isomerase